jgi:phage minor structural protein
MASNMINVYSANETNFNNNGLVVLNDCKTAYVEEMLNDKYEATIEHIIDSRGKWTYLVDGNILKIEGQLFRIYNTTLTLAGITVSARHIFYDLLNNFVETCTITNLNANGALSAILGNTQYTHGYSATSTISATNTYTLSLVNPVDAIMGLTNSVISNYGGEIVRNNFSISLPQNRGVDNGVLVSYGKNIVGIEETLNMDSVCTRIYAIGKSSLLLPSKYLDSALIGNYPHPIVKSVTFSNCADVTSLTAEAQAYLNINDIPLANYKINFIELSKTMEYQNYAVLETVNMGDTVTVKHTRLNIDIKLEVIRIKKNELTNRIEEIELGAFKPNLVVTLANALSNLDSNGTYTGTLASQQVKNLLLEGNTIKAGTIIGEDNGAIINFGTSGGSINTGVDQSVGLPNRAAMRVVPGSITGKSVPGYLEVVEDGYIYFYKDDGSGEPFAYIAPDGTTNLTSTSGGSGSNYFIYKSYADTLSISSLPILAVKESTVSAAFDIQCGQSFSDAMVTRTAISIFESICTVTLT